MIAADTSALISLASIDLLDALLTEFDVHTTETVVDELEATAQYDDQHGHAAATVLDNRDRLQIHDTDTTVETSRIDPGEGSTAHLANQHDADFLITDDLRALPELQTIVDAQVAISPIVLNALVHRNALDHTHALDKLDTLAEHQTWLESPIYRRTRNLFD
jgi:predicted nucleic acid-binding protein